MATISCDNTGATDVTSCINDAIVAAGSGTEGTPVTLTLPAGTYLTSGTVGFWDTDWVDFVGTGATIYSDALDTSGATFYIGGTEGNGSTNISVTGLTITGPTQPRVTSGYATGYALSFTADGESRHGIQIICPKSGATNNITIDTCTISEQGGDGIYVGSAGNGPSPSTITIVDCDIQYCRRHGIGVTNVDGLTITDVNTVYCRWSMLDLEANGSTQKIKTVTVGGVTGFTGRSGLIPITANDATQPSPYGVIGPLTFDNCSLETPADRDLITIKRQNTDVKIAQVDIDGLTTLPGTGATNYEVIAITNADGIDIRNSVIDITNNTKNLWGVWVSTCSGTIDIIDNDWDTADECIKADAYTYAHATITATGNSPNNLGGSPAATPVTVSGTAVTRGVLESEILAGGETIVLTVTGDTWVATVGEDNAITDALIAGIDSNGTDPNGWNAVVKANMVFGDIERTSDTVVTVTLSNQPFYAISADETILVTVPASALTTATEAVVADPVFVVTNEPPVPVGRANLIFVEG